jgi:hypothetical protein
MRARGPGLVCLALAALALPAAAWAADRALGPSIIIDKPGQCVADTQRMRREHPEMLKHQRDKTMHKGIRTSQFSLKGCVECHASSKTGSVLGEQGFCQSCHDYAGIKLDCFECHASKPKLAGGAKQ